MARHVPAVPRAARITLAGAGALPVAAAFAVVVHSLGTVVGILDPPGEFRVTKKAG